MVVVCASPVGQSSEKKAEALGASSSGPVRLASTPDDAGDGGAKR
jgi:hypothetical protein